MTFSSTSLMIISKQGKHIESKRKHLATVSNRYYLATDDETSSATPMMKSPSTKIQNFDDWVSNQQQKLLRTKQHIMMDQGSITGGSMTTNNTILTDEMNEDKMIQRHMQHHRLAQRHMHQRGSEPRKLLPQPLSRTKPPLRRPTNKVSTTASAANVRKSGRNSSMVNPLRAQQSGQHVLHVDKHNDMMMKGNDTSNKKDDEPITNQEVVISDYEGMAMIKLVQNAIQERRNHLISKESMSSTSTSTTTISFSSSSSPTTSVSTSSTPHTPELVVESHIDDDSIFDFSIDQSKCRDDKVSTPKMEKKIQQQQIYTAQKSRMKVASSSSSGIPHPSSPTNVAEFELQSKHAYPVMPSEHEHDNGSMKAPVNEKLAKEIELLKQELSAVKSANVTISRQLDDTVNELYDVKAELQRDKESLHRKTSECLYLREENGLIKKEHSEAMRMNQAVEREQQANVEEVLALKEYIQKLEASTAVVSPLAQDDSVDEHGALIEKLTKELQEKDTKISHLLQDKQQTEIAHEQARRAMQDQLEAQRSEYTSLQDEMNNIQSTHRIVQEELKTANRLLEKENGEVARELNVIQGQLESVNGELNSLKNQYARLQSEHSALQRSHSEQVQQATVLEDSKEELSTKLEQSEDMWKSEVVQLNESNLAMSRELSELRRECEDRMIQHNLELSTMDGEYHNAMVSVDELTKENQQLKCDITSLHDRVSRLEIEKDKMEADFNVEMTQHSKTKTELSAWKLEMLNALNNIELLKKERNDLKAKVQPSKFLCY